MARARPPPKRDSKVKKTWDEGERWASALPDLSPPLPVFPGSMLVVVCGRQHCWQQHPALPALHPTGHSAPSSLFSPLLGHRRPCAAATALPCTAEFWENYRPPAYLTNRYVWAAATAAATVAAVYSASVQRGLLR